VCVVYVGGAPIPPVSQGRGANGGREGYSTVESAM
jgi:hypothetical protein